GTTRQGGKDYLTESRPAQPEFSLARSSETLICTIPWLRLQFTSKRTATDAFRGPGGADCGSSGAVACCGRPDARARGSGRDLESRRYAMLQDFKKFLVQTNALALAVGVIIGGAIGKVVSSLAGD